MLQFYEKRKKVEPLTILFIVFALVLVGSVSYLINYWYQGNKNREKTDGLNELMNDVKGDKKDRYAEIRDKFPDLVGRVSFNYYKDKREYPIMQTKDDPQYYLRRDVEGNYSDWGTIFLDYRDDLKNRSTNLIIYGHSMKDLQMFGCLPVYKKKDYYDKYPNITFETMYDEPATYEIVGSMNARIYPKDKTDVFKYYNFIEAKDESEFNELANNLEENRLYDTGKKLQYGDKVLTLSTCDHSLYGDDGRFVLITRKVEDEAQDDSTQESTN